MLRLLPLILLVACATPAEPEPVPMPAAPECPTPRAVVIAPSPVWPDSCVADWYAKATLPPCVEKYLSSVKTQQKTIAKKRGSK